MSVEEARAGLAGLFSIRNVVAAVLSDLTQSCWLITLSLSCRKVNITTVTTTGIPQEPGSSQSSGSSS